MTTYPGKDIEREAARASGRRDSVGATSWSPIAAESGDFVGATSWSPSAATLLESSRSTDDLAAEGERELAPTEAACCSLSPAEAVAAAWGGPVAPIAAVEPESPADDAGFAPGCYLTSVDGHPLRDIIDWRWLASDDVITVGYIDLDGEAGEVELVREEGESWGFEFDGVLFDRVKLCRNACVFCFMRQLPDEVRPSLVLRDDDFRLSFLSGTFVTLTNLKPEDEARIVGQQISPLRVSLHASEPDLRRAMIGKHAQHGLDALDRLLAAGIQVHAQIVLMPGVNDGVHLQKTLEWAWARPGIEGVGIVPLGFTKHQTALHESFTTPEAALAVIRAIEPFQARARAERGGPWVYAADEFYVNAFGAETPAHIPPASDYGDYDMFEDGIGIVRSYVDEFAEARETGLAARAATALAEHDLTARYVVGEAMQPFLDAMIAASPLAARLQPLTVRNDYFGGNVNVTGLLCGCDIARAVRTACEKGMISVGASFRSPWVASPTELSQSADEAATEGDQEVAPTNSVPATHPAPSEAQDGSASEEQGSDSGCSSRVSSASNGGGAPRSAGCARVQPESALGPVAGTVRATSHARISGPAAELFLIPRVILNDDGLTLDDMTVQDIEKAAGADVHVVSCNPLDYLPEIIALAERVPS